MFLERWGPSMPTMVHEQDLCPQEGVANVNFKSLMLPEVIDALMGRGANLVAVRSPTSLCNSALLILWIRPRLPNPAVGRESVLQSAG